MAIMRISRKTLIFCKVKMERPKSSLCIWISKSEPLISELLSLYRCLYLTRFPFYRQQVEFWGILKERLKFQNYLQRDSWGRWPSQIFNFQHLCGNSFKT
jgi:hypothetical protein